MRHSMPSSALRTLQGRAFRAASSLSRFSSFRVLLSMKPTASSAAIFEMGQKASHSRRRASSEGFCTGKFFELFKFKQLIVN